MNLRSRLLQSVPQQGTASGPAPGSTPAAPPKASAPTPALAPVAQPPEAASAPKTLRPAVLKGMAQVNVWLREQAQAIVAAKVSDKTRELYERNGARLHAARVPGEPVDLRPHEGSASTFYAYRAAVRWHAAQRGLEAAKAYDKASRAHDKEAAAIAWQQVVYAAADLAAYPKDGKPGLPSPNAIALGLDDPKPEGAPARAKREGRTMPAPRETAKLKAANSIARRYPNWRSLVWARLVEVRSPWLDHTAVAALTGARPEELRTARVRRNPDGLIEIGITGAKVTESHGQPWRMFTLRDDGSEEFAHLDAKAGAAWRGVDLPEGVTDYPDAFSAALSRAGASVLPKAERLSGYVYRHAMASDLKADGFTRQDIASALGHAVTKTQDAYGRAVGGVAGRRHLSVQCAREVKVNHDTRYTTPAPVAPAPDSITFATPGFNGPQT